MNIDINKLWENFDYWVKVKNTNIKKLCNINPDLNYGTVTQNRSKRILPSLTTTVNICEALSISLEQLLEQDAPPQEMMLEAKAVQESERLQRIIRVLQQNPEKLDALETFLDIKHAAGGGNNRKRMKA